MTRDSPLTRGRINHPLWSSLPPVGTSVLLGLPVYWFALMLAFYEVSPPIWPELAFFTTVIALFGTITGLTVLLSAAWEPEAMAGQLFAFGILGSLSFNAAVIGVGSVVSALNAEQDSVTAALSMPEDIFVASTYLAASLVLGHCAQRFTRPRASGSVREAG